MTLIFNLRGGYTYFLEWSQSDASFGESGGEFSQQASPGFIELFTLQSRLAHRVRSAADERGEG